jgi:peptidylprolyl isomerase
VPTNKQRREAARRHLERQLQRRQEREARQRKVTVITSIIATLVLIGAIVVAVVVLGGGNDKSTKSTAGKRSTSASPSTPAPSSSLPAAGTPAACLKPGKSATTVFDGVTVKDGTNLKKAPQVTSKLVKEPTALMCQDLVVGTGKAATPTSTVSVQYAGVLYKDGTAFDSSWANGGKPVEFSLTGVVPGFTQGIGGTGKVSPMKVGGRRIIILPASLGYGSQASGAIPANSSLVFIVDLTAISSATSSSASSTAG